MYGLLSHHGPVAPNEPEFPDGSNVDGRLEQQARFLPESIEQRCRDGQLRCSGSGWQLTSGGLGKFLQFLDPCRDPLCLVADSERGKALLILPATDPLQLARRLVDEPDAASLGFLIVRYRIG